MNPENPTIQRPSTRCKHSSIYDRYLELLQEARSKINGASQMMYTSFFYQQLCEEYGYGLAYISTIINRERRRREAAEKQAAVESAVRAGNFTNSLSEYGN